jgi:hypothetical protein
MRHRHALAAAVVALALLGAACGGGDDDSVSTGTTSTTAGSSDFGGDGNDVLAVQRALNALDCDAGPLDGELGPDTLAAIRRFQSAAGIEVDGIVGPRTRAAIEHASATGSPVCTNVPTPPAPSTTPTSSGGGGSTPPCTDPAIRGAITASLLPGEQLNKLNPFQCAITWAVATPTITSPSDPSGTNVTYLLRWSGTAWQPVDRGTYCDSGQVPKAIFPQACQAA